MNKIIDLTGFTIGWLTVLHRGDNQQGRATWVCHCICGTTTVVRSSSLRKQNPTTSCGCKRKITIKNLNKKNFGRLTVICDSGERFDGQVLWLCNCSCGNRVKVRSASLQNGHTQSCGCLQKEVKSNYKHGKAGTQLYKAWHAMFARCYNLTDISYANYGGRDIGVCIRWHDFDLFCIDMGVPPPNTSLDRINNDGNYAPENCRWATRKQQMNNRTITRFLTHCGVTRSLTEWAEIVGVTSNAIRLRLGYGWTIEEALTTSLRHKNNKRILK